MANCNSRCGCSGCHSYSSACRSGCSGTASYTPVGALSTLCRTCGTGCCENGCNYPFYTGPCPPAPCCNKCGCSTNSCENCGNSCVCSDGYGSHGCNRCGSGSSGRNACKGSGGPCGCDARSCTGHCGWATNTRCSICGCTDGSCGCSNRDAYCSTCGCTDRSCACHSHCGDNCCDDCGSNGRCEETFSHVGYGVFAVNGPFNISNGGAVCLSARNVNSHYFAVNGGNIIIRRPGVYHASVTVDIPAGMDADTILQMEVDNQCLVPPELEINTDSHSSAHNYAGHTVFHAVAGSVLKLSSLKTLCCPDATSHPVITLTLMRAG